MNIRLQENQILKETYPGHNNKVLIGVSRLKKAMKLAKIGYWYLDIINDISVYWSEELRMICDVYDKGNENDIRFFLPFIHIDDRQIVLEHTTTAIKEGRDSSLDFRIISAKSLLKHIRSTFFCHKDVNGRTINVFGIIQDITELKTTQLKLERALIKSKELSELKSKFVVMASHQFRTPLTTILSSTELIDLYGQKEEYASQRKHLSKINSSVNILISILDDFLSLDKLESDSINLSTEVTSLHELVDSVITSFPESDFRNIDYKHHGSDQITIDRYILKNILLNLLSNAIKYSPPKSTIKINSTQKEKILRIHITDKGIGIPTNDQKNLFKSFFRASNVAHIKGTGLGLVIVRRYLDLLNGTITFRSSKREGTTFSISIPL